MANDKNKRTDPDFKPQRGQEGNQNWDDSNNDKSNKDTEADKSNTSTPGAGSSQRSDTSDTGAGSVGPLDADLEQKTSEERLDRGNLTGPGLG